MPGGDRKDRGDAPQPIWVMTGAGLQLAAAIGGSALVGWLLDDHFDTFPLLSVILVLAGTVGGFVTFIRALRILGD